MLRVYDGELSEAGWPQILAGAPGDQHHYRRWMRWFGVVPAPPAPASAESAASAPSTPSAPSSDGLQVESLSFDAENRAVRIATTSKPDYKHFALNEPDRIVIDVRGTLLDTDPTTGTVTVGRDGVSRIRYCQDQLDPPVLRVVLDLEKPLPYRVETSDSEVLIRLQ